MIERDGGIIGWRGDIVVVGVGLEGISVYTFIHAKSIQLVRMMRFIFVGVLVLFLSLACSNDAPKTEFQAKEAVCNRMLALGEVNNRNQCGLAEEFTLEDSLFQVFGRNSAESLIRNGMTDFDIKSEGETEDGYRIWYTVLPKSRDHFELNCAFTLRQNELKDVTCE